MKKGLLAITFVCLTTLSACSSDKITGTYSVSGHCPDFFETDNIEFNNGEILNTDQLDRYEFTGDNTIEFYATDDDEAYIGTFDLIEEENGFTIDHENGNYTCMFSQ